jgi:hypothetical protein
MHASVTSMSERHETDDDDAFGCGDDAGKKTKAMSLH